MKKVAIAMVRMGKRIIRITMGCHKTKARGKWGARRGKENGRLNKAKMKRHGLRLSISPGYYCREYEEIVCRPHNFMLP
jgi:hypothetical protein